PRLRVMSREPAPRRDMRSKSHSLANRPSPRTARARATGPGLAVVTSDDTCDAAQELEEQVIDQPLEDETQPLELGADAEEVELGSREHAELSARGSHMRRVRRRRPRDARPGLARGVASEPRLGRW